MTEGLTPEQIAMYKEAFNRFDRSGKGAIATKELGGVMRNLGQNPTEADLADMIAEVDKDGNGEIDFDEFLQVMSKFGKDEDTSKRCVEAFKVFDKNKNGRIHKNDLENILLNIGEKSSREEVAQLLEVLDINENGEFDYETFVKKVLSWVPSGTKHANH